MVDGWPEALFPQIQESKVDSGLAVRLVLFEDLVEVLAGLPVSPLHEVDGTHGVEGLVPTGIDLPGPGEQVQGFFQFAPAAVGTTQ